MVYKSSIVKVIDSYVLLRRAGHEFVGLCPFHAEKTPSFSVNEEKGLFYCHSCGAGGDVITFIEQVEGLDFKGALSHLGMSREKLTCKEITRRMIVKAASESLSVWAWDLAMRISNRMREAGNTAHLARKVLRELPSADKELLESKIKACEKQWNILEVMQDDLLNPEFTLDLWKQREVVEGIVDQERCAT